MMAMICHEEAQAHFNAQKSLEQTETDLADVTAKIDAILNLYAPGLVIQRDQLETEKSVKVKVAKTAKDALTLALNDVARTMANPYGKHAVFPYATVQDKTFVEVNDPVLGAMWFASRGMADKIKFDTTPISVFQAVPEDQLPRMQNGIGFAIRIYQAPNAVIDAFDKWDDPSKEEADE